MKIRTLIVKPLSIDRSYSAITAYPGSWCAWRDANLRVPNHPQSSAALSNINPVLQWDQWRRNKGGWNQFSCYVLVTV